MQVGLKPKVNNISIKKIGKQYEINFGDEIWIYLDSRKDLAELRDKINDILIYLPQIKKILSTREDYKSDMLREKQDYIEEVKLAGGKVD